MKCPHCMKEIRNDIGQKGRTRFQEKVMSSIEMNKNVIPFLGKKDWVTIKDIYFGIGFLGSYRNFSRKLYKMEENKIIEIKKDNMNKVYVRLIK